MNIASIDIGSNTVLLLIAKKTNSNEVYPRVNEYEAPRLGRGLKSDGMISEESINKLMTVLKRYSILIKEYRCEKTICTATNAMRIAKNSQEIIERAKNNYSIDINVISGEREAELSFLGASATLQDVSKKIVLDIGGGSTEIIIGEETNIHYKKSFPIGAVNTTELFYEDMSKVEPSLSQMSKYITNEFSEIESDLPKGIPIIAVAGTPTTLSAINNELKEYDESIIEGSKLSVQHMNKFINEFSKSSPTSLLNKYGKVIKGREDVILAGTLILKTATELTGNHEVTVSAKGIRYGSIIDYLKTN